MSLSMYQASVPVINQMLGSLKRVLEKGAEHAAMKKFDPSNLIQARLIADMLALPKQVQIACDAAKFAVARLGGVEAPKFDDSETTFEQLIERIDKTLAFIASVPAAQIDGTEDKDLSIPVGPNKMDMKGQRYLLQFALPNMYFHVTTAYALLRMNGVEVSKRDFLGTF
jgi:uncharacterized protein